MAPGNEGPEPPEPQRGTGPDIEAIEAGAPEHRVAGTPHAMAANAAVLALARAARSFTLYDPSNKVVRALISEYRDKVRHVLEAFGPLELEVHPFELLLGREIVYVERDRERSLAFRLFRDGVRRVGVQPGVTWKELLRLLQILSIRYTGVRQQEDDLVTLLRKAGFDNLRIFAIEGFVPEEEHSEPPLGNLLRGATDRYDPPPQWDQPLPPFEEPAPLRHRPVEPALLARLGSEEGDEAVPALAVRAVAELLDAPGRPDHEAVLGFALEVREFLLVEKRVDLLRELPRLVRSSLAGQPEVAGAFLESFLDARTLRALVTTLEPGEAEVPPDLADLLDAVPGDTLGRLLDLLLEEGAGPRGDLVRRLVVRGSRHAPGPLMERLRGAKGELAAALLRLLADVDPQAALRAAVDVTPQSDPALQRDAVARLEAATFTPEVARTLHHLVGSAHEDVRIRALTAMAARGGARVFAALLHHAEKHAATLTTAEARAAGEALARSSARSALDAFSAWLEPKGAGLLGRLVHAGAPAPLQHAALAGLERIGGEEAGELLALLAEHGPEDVATRARASLEARGRGSGGGRG